MGRKKVEIDWKRVDQMAMAQCCGVEIAEALGVHYDTLVKKCKTEHKTDLSEYLRLKKQRGKAFAKEKFYEKAWIKGDTTAQIFWSKQHLGWTDKQKPELQISAKVENVRFELPDNGTGPSGARPLPPGWETNASGGEQS